MSSDEHSDKPVLALLLTEHMAGLLNAALSHYRSHLRRHAPVWPDGDEMQRAAPDIEELQRTLVEEARNPLVPPRDVEIIAKLAMINKARRMDRTEGEAWRAANALFSKNYIDLIMAHQVPVYCGHIDGDWHFGVPEAKP